MLGAPPPRALRTPGASRLGLAAALPALLACAPCCVKIDEQQRPPRVTVERRPLPPVRLPMRLRLRAVRFERGVTVSATDTCEVTTVARITGTQRVERTLRDPWKSFVPLVAATGGGLVVDVGSRGGGGEGSSTSFALFGALVGGAATATLLVVNELRGADRTAHIDTLAFERQELACGYAPLSITSVVLVLSTGARVTRVTDAEGRVTLPQAVDALVTEVEALGATAPVEDGAGEP